MAALGLRLAQGAAPDLLEAALWHHPEKRRSTHYCTAMYHINRLQSLAVFSGVHLCMGWIWGWETDRHSAKLQSEHRAARIGIALWWHHLFCQGATSTATTCASRVASSGDFCFFCAQKAFPFFLRSGLVPESPLLWWTVEFTQIPEVLQRSFPGLAKCTSNFGKTKRHPNH